MQFTTTIILPLMALISSSLAAPTTNAPALIIKPSSDIPIINLSSTSSSGLSKRQSANSLTYCNSINFDTNEGCSTVSIQPYVCNNFPAGYVNSISSIRPERGQVCAIYMDRDCKGSVAYNLQYPGLKDLRTYGINDNIESILCWVAPSC